MRVILFLVIFFGIFFAENIDEFVYLYLLENESFSVEKININGRAVYLVSIDHPISFIVMEEGLAPLINKEEIKNILSEYYGVEERFDEELWEIKEAINEFNRSRGAEEEKCKFYVGIDRHPCFDRDSCFKACIMIPLCRSVVQGARWPFVDEILKFSEGVNRIESGLTHFHNLSNLDINIDILMEGVENMSIGANEISKNLLFSRWGYSFCYPINFNFTALTKVKFILVGIKNKIKIDILNETERILSETLWRMEIAEERSKEIGCKKIESEIFERFELVELKGERALLRVNYSLLKDKINELKDIKNNIPTLCENKNFSDVNKSAERFFKLAGDVEELSTELSKFYGEVIELYSVCVYAFMKNVSEIEEAESIGKKLSLISKKINSRVDYNELLSINLELTEIKSKMESEDKKEEDIGLPLLIIFLVMALLFTIGFLKLHTELYIAGVKKTLIKIWKGRRKEKELNKYKNKLNKYKNKYS